jgi:hypothetical protein
MEEVQCYEGCGLEGTIRCIFLCEFHPTAGPKITCQVWPKVKYTFLVSFFIVLESLFLIIRICKELSLSINIIFS